MKIQIWSDVVCPWCYIGKRRMEKALEQFDEDVELEWRSFELDPHAQGPSEKPLDEALAAKYGIGVERARQMLAQMTQTAESEGLDFDFANAKGGNTLDAHRVLHLAKKHGLQAAMKERLMRAYFTEGRPIAERDELAELAGEVGLDAGEVRAMLESNELVDEVRADEAKAREIGVSGVPFFFIDEKFGIPGAQPADTLLDLLERVRAKTRAEAAAGPNCDDGSCDVAP